MVPENSNFKCYRFLYLQLRSPPPCLTKSYNLVRQLDSQDHWITQKSEDHTRVSRLDLLHSQPPLAPIIETVSPDLYQWTHLYCCRVYIIMYPSFTADSILI